MPSVSEQSGAVPEIAQGPDAEPERRERGRVTVSAQDVHLTYRTVLDRRANTLRQRLMRIGRSDATPNVLEVKALRGVSFEVTQGTVMGIVGPNGAGKSTLMRAIAGILPPTSGMIEVHGRVSTLLALGVGFNPTSPAGRTSSSAAWPPACPEPRSRSATRRSRHCRPRDGFIDMPMRTYSSGMSSRLAFAVAVHMEPDILLVDEALSAGDAKFRRRASAKMRELMGQARTIFLVSHALGSVVDLCNDAIFLQEGKIVARGEPQRIVDMYTESLDVKQDHLSMEEL